MFLFTISLGSFVVYSATQNLENSIKLGLGAKATIITDFDRDKAHVSDYQPDLETLNVYTSLIQLFDDLGKLDYVSDMDYRLSNFTPDSYRVRLQSPDFVCTDDGQSICNTTIVKGVSTDNLLNLLDFNYEIVDGRMLTQEEIDLGLPFAVIDDSDFKFHFDGRPLAVGDSVNIYTNIGAYINKSSDNFGDDYLDISEFQVEVVGIIRTPEVKMGQDLFIPAKFFMKEKWEIDNIERALSDIEDSRMSRQLGVVDKNIFYLESVDYTHVFKEEVESIFDQYNISAIRPKIITSSDEYNAISGPIENMKKLGSIMVNGSVLASGLILSLVLYLVIKDRRKETGIYLAMGESTSKIIALQFTEILIITILAFSISLVTSRMVAETLSNNMIKGQRNFIKETIDETASSDKQEALLDEYRVDIEGKVYILMFALAMGILTVSIIPMAIDIVKTNPKKILL